MNPLLQKHFDDIDRRLDALEDLLAAVTGRAAKAEEARQQTIEEQLQQRKELVTLQHKADTYDAIRTEHDLAYLLSFDEDNANSIVCCLTSARENARQIREQISSEMWEQLNRMYLVVREAEQPALGAAPRVPHLDGGAAARSQHGGELGADWLILVAAIAVPVTLSLDWFRPARTGWSALGWALLALIVATAALGILVVVLILAASPRERRLVLGPAHSGGLTPSAPDEQERAASMRWPVVGETPPVMREMYIGGM